MAVQWCLRPGPACWKPAPVEWLLSLPAQWTYPASPPGWEMLQSLTSSGRLHRYSTLVPGNMPSPSPQWEVSLPPQWPSVGSLQSTVGNGQAMASTAYAGERPQGLPPNTRIPAVGTAPGPCPVGWGGLEGWVLTRGPCSFLGLPYLVLVPLALSSMGWLDSAQPRRAEQGLPLFP